MSLVSSTFLTRMTNLISTESSVIIEEFKAFISNREFPCIAAKAALGSQHIECMVAGHMACPADDRAILQFLYNFVDQYRKSEGLYYSASVIFRGPGSDEEIFDKLLWERLQALSDLDAKNYEYDKRVDKDPSSGDFSFSLKEEALFIIGLHPESTRMTRRFAYPTLVFNPHAQFEKLRETNRYERMKDVVRKRDVIYSGSTNPMLKDYGESSEVYQYSGRMYDADWQCPLEVKHAETERNSSA